jgi:hypothetical protein
MLENKLVSIEKELQQAKKNNAAWLAISMLEGRRSRPGGMRWWWH